MIDVVALGEMLIDFTTKEADKDGYPTLVAHPGGAHANFLAALAKYGTNTALLAKVGTDVFGNLLLKTIKECGIETSGVNEDPAFFTTLAFVTLDASGDREFSFARKPGADTQLRFEELKLSLIDEAKVFHFGTLSLTDEPSRTATKKAVAYAKERGKLITCDPNLRKPLWNSEEEAKEQMEWALHQADIVKISEDEVEFLWGCNFEEGGKKLIKEYGVKLAFVTLGRKGAMFINENGAGIVPNYEEGIITVDTTGAGDIFGGSAISRILKSGKAPETLSADELRNITSFACAAASLSTASYGGITSVPDEKHVNKLAI